MKGFRYKKGGWFGESHRHYLAAKGIKTASKRYFMPRDDPSATDPRKVGKVYKENPKGPAQGVNKRNVREMAIKQLEKEFGRPLKLSGENASSYDLASLKARENELLAQSEKWRNLEVRETGIEVSPDIGDVFAAREIAIAAKERELERELTQEEREAVRNEAIERHSRLSARIDEAAEKAKNIRNLKNEIAQLKRALKEFEETGQDVSDVDAGSPVHQMLMELESAEIALEEARAARSEVAGLRDEYDEMVGEPRKQTRIQLYTEGQYLDRSTPEEVVAAIPSTLMDTGAKADLLDRKMVVDPKTGNKRPERNSERKERIEGVFKDLLATQRRIKLDDPNQLRGKDGKRDIVQGRVEWTDEGQAALKKLYRNLNVTVPSGDVEIPRERRERSTGVDRMGNPIIPDVARPFVEDIRDKQVRYAQGQVDDTSRILKDHRGAHDEMSTRLKAAEMLRDTGTVRSNLDLPVASRDTIKPLFKQVSVAEEAKRKRADRQEKLRKTKGFKEAREKERKRIEEATGMKTPRQGAITKEEAARVEEEWNKEIAESKSSDVKVAKSDAEATRLMGGGTSDEE